VAKAIIRWLRNITVNLPALHTAAAPAMFACIGTYAMTHHTSIKATLWHTIMRFMQRTDVCPTAQAVGAFTTVAPCATVLQVSCEQSQALNTAFQELPEGCI
jgi:hypothetical protein